MSYGSIRMTKKDIELLETRLPQSMHRVTASRVSSTSDEEPAFYSRVASEIATWTLRVAAMRPGKIRLSEPELLFLRGLLVEERAGDLAKRCVEAKNSGSADASAILVEYDAWISLKSKLEKPFELDRSQDAAPEEEEEEEDD